MSVTDSTPHDEPHRSSPGYELRLHVHALACVLQKDRPDLARVEELLRGVLDLARRTLDRGEPLPSRPFDYLRGGTAIGPGALLAEYLDPGTTHLAALLPRLDSRLVAALDSLVTLAEGVEAPPAERTWGGAGAGALPVLLEPVGGWHVVARAEIGVAAALTAPTSLIAPGDADPVTEAAGPGGRTVAAAGAGAAVDRALEAARRLVADAGPAQPPVRALGLAVPGALDPSRVDGSAALAAALDLLAGEGGLRGPGELGVLPLADCAEDGSWKPYDDVDGLSEQAVADGLRVLRRFEGGWRLDTTAGHLSGPDPSLEGAARLLWPDGRWDEARRGWAARALEAYGWELVHPAAATGRERAPGGGDWLARVGTGLVAFEQAAFLAQQFRRRPHARVIQSGTHNSGKTVCAAQVVRVLETEGWRSVVIRPQDHQLPLAGALVDIVRSALTAVGLESYRRTLVVLEDLYPLSSGRIGEALESLGVLRVAVLALTQYVEGAGHSWQNDGVIAYMTPVAADGVADLARRMVREHPQTYRAVRGDAEADLAAAACQGDLGLLADLLRDGVRETGEEENGRSDLARPVRQKVEQVWAGLDDPARDAVCRLAAVALIDADVPVAQLVAVPESTRTGLGVVEHHGRARIPSAVVAEAVLDRAGAGGADALSHHLRDQIVAELAAGDHRHAQTLLAKGAAYLPDTLADLLRRTEVREAITAWAATADPPAALRLLRLCRGGGEDFWIAGVLPSVIARIPATPELTVSELTTALATAWIYQHHLEDKGLGLLEWLRDGGLAAVLSRPSSLQDRSHFVRRLLRLASDDTIAGGTVAEWLEEQADGLVRGARSDRHRDLISIRDMDTRIGRKSRRGRRQGHGELRPLEKSVQALLHRRPTRQSPLGAILAWMSLRLHFNGSADWDELIWNHESQIRAALAHADAIEIRDAVADLASNNRGLSTRLLNSLKLGTTLGTTLKTATPAEAALLISTIRNVHGATVKALLYRETEGGSPTVNAALTRQLAASIGDIKDGRGAGMLLSSVSRADDLYCDTRDGGFGYALAEELGPEFARRLMRRERRPAVLYHFLHGLWAAGASYRQELEEQALELVVSSIQAQRGAVRPWGPRLAMLLIDDDYFGQAFLLRLASRIDVRVLGDRMRSRSLDPQSMVHMYRLGLAIDPQFGARFAADVSLDRVVGLPLRRNRAGDVAQRLQVIAGALRSGGHRDAATVVRRHFEEQNPEWSWARALRASSSAGALATGINQLRAFHPADAAEAVRELDSVSERAQLGLGDRLRNSVTEPQVTADLLLALERCEPGLGVAECANLRADRGRWSTLIDVFKYEQDPITQGGVGRSLARLGVLPATERTEWMRTLVLGRWSSTLHLLASPRAVKELLALGYVWEPQWGEQLATNIDAGRLLNRIGLGMRHDLRELPHLVNLLRLTGRRDVLAGIADYVTSGLKPRLLAEALGLEHAGRLLLSLRVAGQDVDVLTPAVGDLLARVIARPRVADAEKHWTSIGWAAQALAECGAERHLPDVPPALEPNTTAYPAAVAWAAAWLPAGDWSSAATAEALPLFERTGTAHWYPGETCMALVAASRKGWLPADGPLATPWLTATDASPELVTLLCREAAGTPAVAEHLRSPAVAERLWRLAESPVTAIRPCHRELRRSVEQWCPRPAVPGPSPTDDLGL